MDEDAHAIRSERVAASVILAAFVAYGWGALRMTGLRSDDFVGPSGMPLLIAAVGVLASIVLLVRPDRHCGAADIGGKVWLYWLAIVVYVVAFPWLGFGISSFAFLVATFVILRVAVLRAVLLALVVTAALWLVFARLLDIELSLVPWS
jgi:hypothetical protein